jgi:LmbE family N-acetylglucosaminyl deacetylase
VIDRRRVRARLRPAAFLRRRFYAGVRDETARARQASAVVIAPHQDDEVLGCGGTILLKRAAGAAVNIVFMCDGSTSHSRFIAADALSRLRRQEALDAAQALGLAAADVQFLDLPESQLAQHHQVAVAQVLAILLLRRPEEVYVPYRWDGTPDHEATFRIVAEAVGKSGLALRVCEYPIWLWNRWPWVPLPIRASRVTLREMRGALGSGLGLNFFRRFRTGVAVTAVMANKRAALAQHRSQMAELVPGVGWPTLAGVSEGGFLDCFFQDYEVFHCWEAGPVGG